MRANRESNMSCPDALTSGQLAAEQTAWPAILQCYTWHRADCTPSPLAAVGTACNTHSAQSLTLG